MDVLSKAPYNLPSGELIIFRVNAQNSIGPGVFSNINTEGAKLITKPPAMAMPELDSANVKQLNLSWATIPGSGIKYELFGDNDDDSTFNSVTVTDKTTFTVKKELGDLSYNFKVRASNVCGFGPDSPVNKINLVLAPARVAKPTRIVNDCSLFIEWESPDPHGSPILDYSVEVQGKDFNSFFKL
jgi:hypothetical protein